VTKPNLVSLPFYDYILLPHPKSIIDFEWREPDSHRDQLKAALLTTCVDSVARLWSQSELGHGFQNFNLAGVIDPSGHIFGNRSPERGTQKVPSVLHWLTARAFHEALTMSNKALNFKETLNQRVNTKLLDTLLEFPDMLFEITANGTMVIWGIQGLGMSPHRVTKVNLILRSEGTVPKEDFGFFGSVMAVTTAQDPQRCLFSSD
jgi:hypothetical protein